VKFSLFHLSTFFLEFHPDEHSFYQRMLQETEKAEALGFHSVWFAEHHFFNYGGHIPSVPVIGAAVAQRTRRIRIGSGIALLPLQDPIRIAEEFALLDCLSGGRLDFGIGRGFQKAEYDAFERDMADSRALFEEAHEIILKAWTSEHFSYNGKFHRIHDLRVVPKPLQKPPPIYVACIFTPESFEWAGRRGYNLMVVPYALPTQQILIDNLRVYREARTAHGHTDEPELMAVYHFYCGQTAVKGKEEPRAAMLRYLSAAAESNREPAYSQQYANYANLRGSFKVLMDYDEVLYPNRLIFGNPEQCIRRIEDIQSMGVTNVGLLVNFGGLEREQVMGSLERCAAHVMPRFENNEPPGRSASAGR
jgi:natural product biosynthesis luciferase-like monooxygenase protein